MNFLLDTNVCIALIQDKPPAVRKRANKKIDTGSALFVSTVALHELWYGVEKSSRPETSALEVRLFLSGLVQTLPFDEEDARAAGKIRAALEAAGKPIGAYDALIAAQALARGMILVTANLREFSRVKGLVWEDWSR